MSYILDALRKAESERERGQIPGVHAQPAFVGGIGPRAAARRAGPWVTALLATIVVLLLALVVWMLARPEPSATVALSPATPAVPATPAAPAIVSPGARQADIAGSPAPAAMTPTLPTPTPAPTPTTTPVPARKSRNFEAPAPAIPPPSSTVTAANNEAATPAPARTPAAMPTASRQPTPGPAAAVAPPPIVPTSSGSENRVYAQSELPDEIRRQLPALAIGGSMYSPVAANRILIINGQVLHEGERVTPELQLLQIKLKAAVMAFRGYRYEVAF